MPGGQPPASPQLPRNWERKAVVVTPYNLLGGQAVFLRHSNFSWHCSKVLISLLDSGTVCIKEVSY